MEETSLDDFLTTERAAASGEETNGEASPGSTDAETSAEGSDESGTAASAVAGTAADVTAEDGQPAEPAVTAAWSGDAPACGECDEPAAWRWAQDGMMVCPSCKEW